MKTVRAPAELDRAAESKGPRVAALKIIDSRTEHLGFAEGLSPLWIFMETVSTIL